MEPRIAINFLAALAQDTRLTIFRLLVQKGSAGMPAGAIAEALGLPAPTLSFHLTQLKQAGLLSCRRASRSLIYAADYAAMNGLLSYLTENCCGVSDLAACAPSVCAPAAANPASAKAKRRAS